VSGEFKANGLHFSSDALLYVGDGPPIPVTDFKLELREPFRADHSDTLAFWTGQPQALQAREIEPGVWEVAKE
jgi:hypothetical protein